MKSRPARVKLPGMARLAHGALFASATILFFACSGGDDNGDDDINLPYDGGMVGRDGGEDTTGRDGGFRDAGPADCASNPNGCVENQLRGPECQCLAMCEGGFEWNQVTQMCDPLPEGECAVDSDCLAQEACIDVPANGGLTACAGQATCRCLPTCDPWVRFQQSDCPPQVDFGAGAVDVACTWVGASATLPEALCLPENMMRGGYGDVCMVTTDAQGNRTSDSCDRNRNYVCLTDGRGGVMNQGVCTRFCDEAQDPDLCETKGEEMCVGRGFADVDPTIGFCQNPPAADIATTCTSSITCSGGICSQILGGSCTQPCGGFDQCDVGDFCISFNGVTPPEQDRMCVKGCATADAAGDTECRMPGHPTLVCRDVFAVGINLCLPPCTQVPCVAANTTCDPVSGRCM